MLRLAMTTDAETFERVRGPLADRGVAVDHVQAKERSLRVSAGADREEAAGGDGEFADFDAGFVYPSRLMEGAVVDTRLSVPWVNGREAVLTSRNKAGVLAALDDAGLPTPRTTLVSNPVDEAVVTEAVEPFPYPVVV
ncbi:alpha-L-glutamate ligase, partial [Halorubrum sp. E3]